MGDISNVLGGPWSPPSKRNVDPPEMQLRSAIVAAGLTPPEEIVMDGRIHRFNSDAKRAGKGEKTGWMVAFGDGTPAGRFGCWRTGIEIAWKADVGRELTAAEQMTQSRRMAEARAIRDRELEKSREVAAQTCEQIWAGCMPATADHPYLSRKGVQPHGARATGDGRLVVPMWNDEGELVSLQYIDHAGNKLFHPGGKAGESYWLLGSIDGGSLYLAEGFATAATIHEVTGRPCLIAYSASNLSAVAAFHKDSQLIVVADNDESGTGRFYADQAVAKYGGAVIMPPEIGDVNDYAQAGGDVHSLLIPATGDAIISKLQAVFGSDLSDEYEAPDELIEGLMTTKSLSVLYGDSNSGKTFLALAMATAIASNESFFGKKVDGGLVIYLASEAPGSIRSRMQAIKKYYGCSLADLVMVPVPVNFYDGDGDAMDVVSLVKEVERIRGKPARLIIGDTLARMSAGANENSGEDMGPVMARFDRIAAATSAAVLIIHHNGKDAAKGARGWSGIRAHIDTEIEVVEKDGVRSASVTKQRELPGKGEAIYFKLEVVEMGLTKFGAAATTCVAVCDEEGAEAKPHKKPTKYDEHLRILQRAWFATGADEVDGLPYVSRSALKTFLVQNMDWSERTIRNKLDASRQDGILMPLFNAQAIEMCQHGYRVIDNVLASAWMIAKVE